MAAEVGSWFPEAPVSYRLLARALTGFCLFAAALHAHAAVPLLSQHAVVVDESTGQVLLAKNADEAAPMASLTKLLTAIVVLDAKQDPAELLTIEDADLDTLKHTRAGVPPGTVLPRAKLLELALLASDNHAASALARHYPGGLDAFLVAVKAKASALKLTQTEVVEPTGLSPLNRSNAADLARVLAAAAGYPEIAQATSQEASSWSQGERTTAVKNTNKLVGKPGWDILLSKTGFTNEAGRCLAMRLRTAGRTVLVVLMDAAAGTQRTLDALNVQRWLAGQPALAKLPPEFAPVKQVRKPSRERVRKAGRPVRRRA